jgi:hypothetical protein
LTPRKQPAEFTPEPLVEPTALPATPTEAPPILTPTPTKEAPIIPQHPIQIRMADGEAEFYNSQNGARFSPHGVNYFHIISTSNGLQDRFFGVDNFDPLRVSADFEALKESGFNTIRIFLDSCNGGSGCVGNPIGSGLNSPYIDNIAETMRLAKERGLFLLLTSNDLPDQGGYWNLSNWGSGAFFGGYRNAHYLTEEGVNSGVLYWGDLLSALAEREAPFDVVLGWSLLNEQWFFGNQPPFSLDSGSVTTANGKTYDLSVEAQKQQMAIEGISYYIQSVREVIDRYDPTALVTMGFFVPAYPNPARSGDFRYVETVALLDHAPLDFFDFHAYPGFDMSLPQHAENFGIVGYGDKPVILGESGAFIDRFATSESAARAMQNWIAESCDLGFDGWLYWGLYRAPEAIGDATWGFMDEGGLMMEALTPVDQSNPCSFEQIPSANLAFGKAVTASRFLPEEPPGNAVDGGPAQWGSGSDAPQWVEIDLGAPATVELIRLWVAQWPAGETIHELWVRGEDGELQFLHTFQGNTAGNDILEFEPAEPLLDVVALRVVTTQSPSWVAWSEIEIFGSHPNTQSTPGS